MATIRGGDKFQRAMAELARKIEKPATLRVGFLGGTYPDGTPIPLVAALNEYGVPSRGQPPRPFMRRMIDQRQGEWASGLAVVLKANDMDAEKTLKIFGPVVEGQIKQSIDDFFDPPLAPSTIKRKGFSKPLTDTNLMRRSVASEVKT